MISVMLMLKGFSMCVSVDVRGDPRGCGAKKNENVDGVMTKSLFGGLWSGLPKLPRVAASGSFHPPPQDLAGCVAGLL